MLAPSYLGFLLTLDASGDNIFAVACLSTFFTVPRYRNTAVELFQIVKIFDVIDTYTNSKSRLR